MPRKSKAETLSLAAALMGKKGGSMNTEAQKTAHRTAGKKNIIAANASLTGNTPEETWELRHKAQYTIPEADRKARARTAVTARWGKREAGMSNEAFRELTAHLTAQEIADGIGATAAKVSSWRRKSNPVKITPEDAAKILAYVHAHKHTDRLPDRGCAAGSLQFPVSGHLLSAAAKGGVPSTAAPEARSAVGGADVPQAPEGAN